MYNPAGGKTKIKTHRPRINQQIRVPEVRVVDQKGQQIGVMSATEAIKLAQEQNLDLVEVAPNARPSVVRILDFRKYQFEKKQREKGGKKHSKTHETKELRFGPNIGVNDLQIRIGRARDFLSDGDKVKLTVQFKGREISHPELGFEKINAITKALSDVAKVEKEPERKGRFIHTVLGQK